jgi:hypothetical protein
MDIFKAGFLMRVLTLGLLVVASAAGQIHPDDVLLRMAPAGTVSLVGARMDELKNTPLYQKLVAQKKLADLDRFAAETGFDPRRDVRELLLASNGKPDGTVLLARGTFRVTDFGKSKEFKHGIYVIHGDDKAGFCILDSTLAAAGPLSMLYAALDHWDSKLPPATPELLKRIGQIPVGRQVWSVTQGSGINIPGTFVMKQGAVDFAQIFRGLQQTTFSADLRGGLDAIAAGETKTEDDAKNLGGAARGLIGLGRLSVPEQHRELLRIWDGFHVEQNSRSLTITVKVSQDLIDRLADLLQSGQLGNARAN